MKKTIFLFLLSIFFYGCSTTNDNNSNATTTIIPLAPTNLAVNILSNQIILTWTDNSTNENGFKIERKTGTGSWAEIGSVMANVSGFTDSTVNPGTTYTYRAYSFNSAGNSLNYSNEINISTLLSISTSMITNISTTTATSGGSISFGGGSVVIAKGVVWSTNVTPTIALATKTNDGTGTGQHISSIASLIPNTIYYIRAYATNSSGTAYGNEITFTTLPVITTNAVANIETTKATSGGSIRADGGAPIILRGVVWSTNTKPSIELTTKTTDGTGTGSFTSLMSTLTPNTTYYLRAYTSNSSGTTYGNEITFKSAFPYAYTQGQTLTDIDGNAYPTIKTNCNNKIWMQSNLNVSRFRNGDIIPQVTNVSSFENVGGPAWCYYGNLTANGLVYGKLYNLPAVRDSRGLAPEGWHISTNIEWGELSNCLGGGDVSGSKLKQAGIQLWASPNAATNSSGFTALPGGICDKGCRDMSGRGYFWTPNDDSGSPGVFIIINNFDPNVYGVNSDSYGRLGLSVRCVKD